MIVCICHAVPESVVLEAAAAGLSPAEVAHRTRAGTSCGCCREALAELVARTAVATMAAARAAPRSGRRRPGRQADLAAQAPPTADALVRAA